MSDVNSINGYTQSGTTGTNTASQTLSADMNTFLTLLTTQLKYQDPLDPMDTAEFTNQLVQYSSVEQAIQTNTKLDTLLNMSMSNLGAQAVSYMGKVAQVLGDVMPLQNGFAKATYTLDKNCSSVTVLVKDLDGKVVYSETGNKTAGTHEFNWDGKDSNGNKMEDGAYQIVVTANVASGEAAANVTTTIFGKVTGVASDTDGVYVGLGDSVTANLGDILTVRNDDYFDKDIPGTGEGDGEGDGGEEGDSSSGEGEDGSDAVAAAASVLAAAGRAAINTATLGLI